VVGDRGEDSGGGADGDGQDDEVRPLLDPVEGGELGRVGHGEQEPDEELHPDLGRAKLLHELGPVAVDRLLGRLAVGRWLGRRHRTTVLTSTPGPARTRPAIIERARGYTHIKRVDAEVRIRYVLAFVRNIQITEKEGAIDNLSPDPIDRNSPTFPRLSGEPFELSSAPRAADLRRRRHNH